MKRSWVALLGVVALLGGVWWQGNSEAAPAEVANWIWFDEGDPANNAPTETRYFRRTLPLRRPPDEAILEITADDEFTVWVNGEKIGNGNDWKKVYKFDIKKHLSGKVNVLAVSARNTEGAAGLLLRLDYVPNGQSRHLLVSDSLWKSSKTADDGWHKDPFDDSKWKRSRVLGPVGKVARWQQLAWEGKDGEFFSVPKGFHVEQAVKIPASDDRFSLVNMCFDNRGRLLVSRERGGILLCTKPNKDGVLEEVQPYCTQVKNCQGMCWVNDALYLVGDGPKGVGLYRVCDTNQDDKTDEVTLLHQFRGGMGEHGPHAIIHGPDNWLYLVIGNHAWAQIGADAAKNGVNPLQLAANSPLLRWPTGRRGPDQGQPGTTEDVLLPRLNDANGHAANVLAPGGTIWRLDTNGKDLSLFSAGYRNQFDAAFSPLGEMFTFDSDMEWDEGLPWYRPVRVCHSTPGSDFVWRTGAANTPNYYIDSLPPTFETGRGSPVGVEFYDHGAFPEKYRGAYFMCDWSLGIIYAVHLERAGGSFKARTEKFCTGNPLNVTDCAVGPEGALYFTMGGRNTQGGVYRIVHDGPKEAVAPAPRTAADFARRLIVETQQPLAAWSREKVSQALKQTSFDKNSVAREMTRFVLDDKEPIRLRVKAMTLLLLHNLGPDGPALTALLKDKEAEMRAQAVYRMGMLGSKEVVSALSDADAFVRRRACEALLRAGLEPPLDALWPLLGDQDKFVRTAARLVLQRIEPKKWTGRLWRDKNPSIVREGIVALCKTNQAAPYAEPIFEYLHQGIPRDDVQAALDHLRTFQLALIHASERPGSVRGLALECLELFPHKDKFVNRELAILLVHLHNEKHLESIHGKLLQALLNAKDDRPQQIHYFYCLRLLTACAWTAEQKQSMLAWYDGTKTWTGGNSYTPFLYDIMRDINPIFTAEDRLKVIAKGEQLPWAAVALLRLAPPADVPNPQLLADLFERLAESKTLPSGNALKLFVVEALGKSTRQPEAQAALRKIADKDPAQRDAVARGLARFPAPENFPYLVMGLESANKLVALELIAALEKNPAKPKLDPMNPHPTPWRAALLAGGKLDEKDRWKVVQVLRHWSDNRQFGGDDGDWKTELSSWSKWFSQAFPKEPALPSLIVDRNTPSKYKYNDLLAFVTSPAGKGDFAKGRVVFEKAQCIKCHRFGKEGEGIGPDLSTLSKRFKRADVLEAVYYPSKVISDQYRSSMIVTRQGQQVVGLAAPQGDTLTVLLNDASKVTLKKSDIEQQFASLISVMPEKLFDTLTLEEIADLFAFLESEPAK